MDIQYFQTSFEQIRGKDLKNAKTENAEEVEGTLIKGYASTPTKDRHSDIVEPEAFRKSIKNEYRKNPIILFAHDTKRPIGKATFIQIDEKGLYVEALIVDADIEPKIKAGILRMFSIGYIPKAVSFEDDDGNMLDPKDPTDREKIWRDESVVRKITKLDLVENSIVSVPANPDAEFSLAKSVKSFFDKELAKTGKSIIMGVENNPSSMKDKKNLLDTKDEEVEKDEEKPESDNEKVENEDDVEEKPNEDVADGEGSEKEDEEEDQENSKPAEDETGSSEEGDKKPADEDGEKEGDEEKAFTNFSEGERKNLKFIATPEGAVKAYKSLIEKVVEIAELKDKLATTIALLKDIPKKQAEAMIEEEAEKAKNSKGDEIKGLKSEGFIDRMKEGRL